MSRVVAMVMAIAFVSLAFNSVVADAKGLTTTSAEPVAAESDSPPEYITSLRNLTLRLMEETSDTSDSDGDSIPDSVELVVGTDPMTNDTDYDQLSDLVEILNNMDPLRPDSNSDGIADVVEFRDVAFDVDLDGQSNWWDYDNDGDGVNDGLDISPFSSSVLGSSFHFDIETNGNPTYVNFQLRPNNTDHLRLPRQTWDWPEDWEGQMKQKDGSIDDVEIAPVLELTGTEYYWIVSNGNGACLEVAEASVSDGAIIQTAIQDAQDHKLWMLQPVGGGYYNIVAKHSGKLLEVAYSSQQDGAVVSQHGASGGLNQLWKLIENEDGSYHIFARHSGLSLAVGDELEPGVNGTCQERFEGLDSQLWSLEPLGNFVPSEAEVTNYALGIDINKIVVPLFPVIEYGTTVALTGRLFLPPSGPSSMSMDAKLVWSVSGKTDNIPLTVLSDNYLRYFTLDSNGALVASSYHTSDAFRFEWIDLVGDPSKPISSYFALRTPEGKYFSAKADGRIIADATAIGKNESFYAIPLKWLGVDKLVIKVGGEKFLSVEPDGRVLAVRDSPEGYNSDPLPFPIADEVKFHMMIVDYKLEKISLARYHEPFYLTGFSVEENYGSDVGLFFDSDPCNTLLASLAVSYGYLRNSSNELHEVPTILTDLNVSVDSVIRSFSHSHLALLNATTNMLEETFDELPADALCPILFAFEDRYVIKQLDELVDASHTMGSTCAVNLTAEPVVTTKTLRLNWFDTGSKELIGLDSIVDEVMRLSEGMGYDDETSNSLTGLVIVWNAGESVVTRIGVVMPEFEEPEIPQVLDIIDSYGLMGVDLACRIVKGANAVYRFLKLPAVDKLTTSALSSVSKTFSEVSNAKIGAVAKISRIQACLDIIAWVVTGIIAFYAFLSIAVELGGDFGLYVGGLYALIIVAYAAILFILALTGPVGVAIGIVVAIDALLSEIFDVKLPFTLLFDFWVAVIFAVLTDTKICTEVSMQTKDTQLDIYDFDDNGLDAGDRIEYRGRITGRVDLTSDGSLQDLAESYIRPIYMIEAPNGTNSRTDNYRTEVVVDTDGLTYRATDYETGVWIEPGAGMINFPVVVWLSTSYKVFYLNGYWAFGWHWERESSSGTTNSERSTVYLDVLPGSLDGFLSWKAIASLDSDWDGIWDDYEVGSTTPTDPYRCDTDGDGLMDEFESEVKTDPTSPDSDSDGLSDGRELMLHTDPLQWDTDGDNLSDYMEVNGWVVVFNYSGNEFAWKVRSDPLMRDFDSDGLDDQTEYWLGTSPISRDTDGDGQQDEGRPRMVPELTYLGQWGSQGTSNGQFMYCRGMSVDAAGYLYVVDSGNNRVQRFGPDGIFVTKWGTMGSGAGQFFMPMGISASPSGYVYVADTANHRVQKFTSAGAYVTQWGGFSGEPVPGVEPPVGKFYMPYGLAVDNTNSYVYVADTVNERVQKFTSSGAFLKTWKLNDYVTAIAVDSEGNVYAAEGQSGCIRKYDPDGNPLMSIFPPTGLGIPTFYGLSVDGEGNILGADATNDRIVLFDSRGQYVTAWGSYGTGDGEFDNPWGFAPHPNGRIYVTDSDNSRIQYFELMPADEPPSPPDEIPDIDEDLLLDSIEKGGWTITVVRATGSSVITVTSDPMNPDTDGDGLTDRDEYDSGTDPRSSDTDADGLSDRREIELGTDPVSWDSDGDGLGDGFELIFRSDPLAHDSDSDGLSDQQEHLLGTDPRRSDTDEDGLTDYEEVHLGTDPTNSDSDGDLLFDGQEQLAGTDPNDPDSDSDGLPDGYEILYGTDPMNGDTDGDLLPDGEEIFRGTDPLSNDTDGDGMSDSEEIEMGTNPLQSDSDGDGIIDSEDNATKTPLPDDVVVCIDVDAGVEQWVGKLGGLVNITVVSADDLLSNHTQARFVVLVGEPKDEPGTAGYVIRCLVDEALQGPRDLLADPDGRMVVRYGVWAPLQTVVVLTSPLDADLYTVVATLTERNVSILPTFASSRYSSLTNLVRLDEADFVRATNSSAIVALDTPVTAEAFMASYDESDTPQPLTQATGLGRYEFAMGRYLEIGVSDPLAPTGEVDIQSSLIRMFYSVEDLDRTGDCDADDPEDLDESRLSLYVYNESSGAWESLSTGLPWVLDMGVNVTDIDLYGRSYAGCVWALVAHTSLFALAGETYNRPPDVSDAYPSIEYLWPPNHAFVAVRILGVTDPDGDDVTVTVTGVTSDEPTSSMDCRKPCFFAPDAFGVGTDTAYLRAERLDSGNGRVYVITFVAEDGRGGESTGSVSVYVPHDHRKSGPICIDDGQYYDATEVN